MYGRKMSAMVRSVYAMTIAVVPGQSTDLVIDPKTGWLDEVLAALAQRVANCASPRYAGEEAGVARIGPRSAAAVTSGLDGEHHTIKIITLTGHSYLSRTP
jgi:hypothetical protein